MLHILTFSPPPNPLPVQKQSLLPSGATKIAGRQGEAQGRLLHAGKRSCCRAGNHCRRAAAAAAAARSSLGDGSLAYIERTRRA
jgi:hypothetical protein